MNSEQGTIRPRQRRKWPLLAISAMLSVAAATTAMFFPSAPANGAIAGNTTLLDVPDGTITSAMPKCKIATYCQTAQVNLSDSQVFQVQADLPTATLEIGLYDSLGNKAASKEISANGSGWMSVSVQNDGSVGLGVTPIVKPGTYTLMYGGSTQFRYSIFAFVIPNSLKVVPTNSVTTGEFNDRTTLRISGKYTNYSDGVSFNAPAGAKISVTFSKPGDSDLEVQLYDVYRNEVASAGTSSNQVKIDSYVVPYAGLYQVAVSGSVQGKFTLSVSQYVAVSSVKLDRTSATLKITKKVKHPSLGLVVTVLPTEATNQKVSWSSSNKKIAKVSSLGKVTAMKAGRVKITARSTDTGKKATATIVVKKSKK